VARFSNVTRLTPSDTMFLYAESREQMMHVAGLMLFETPPGTRPDHLRELVDEVRADPRVFPPFNLQLAHPDLLIHPLQHWVEHDDVDLDYHVRRSALPSPGDERELGIVVSRLHGHHIDFHRPPWELHLIEGLDHNRFAIYCKVHHSLVDGFSAMKILVNALSRDPAEHRPLFFAVPQPKRPPREPSGDGGLHFPELLAQVRAQYGATKSVFRALANVAREGAGLVSPREAPRCILNGRIGKSRRFATASLPTARLKAIGKAAGGTLNDAILAVSASSLRRYLLELGALPAAPLVASLPVAVRARDDVGGGNAVAAILATLATDIADPHARIAAIVASTTHAKQQLQGMSKAAILSYSALMLAPSMLNMLPMTAGHFPPTFNVVISNVPGPEESLYFRGARMQATYPMSIPVHGQALNITCNSYAGNVCFGFTGCRDTVPHLQRLAVYCAEAISEYES
jgi:diacylglycerol O-acyltransferase / wax synthase